VRVLLVAATRPEVAPLISSLALPAKRGPIVGGILGVHAVDILVTGVGMVATAAWCSRALATSQYDVAINLGVCGSFNPELPPPAAVHVTRDVFSELGVEDGPALLSLKDIGLQDPNTFPFSNGYLENLEPPPLPTLADLPAVSGITVNTAHGDEQSIARVVERWSPDVESMEGAAFMYACRIAGVPFAQVRAVSNRMERRNRAAWDLVGAVRQLARVSRRLLELP
jgi:futalosine hydrolase